MSLNDGMVVHVWREQGECFINYIIRDVDRYGGGYDMVWDGFSRQSTTPVHVIHDALTALRYHYEIFAIPYLALSGDYE